MSLDAAVAIEGETRSRVAFSDAALAMILQLREQHGPLMFHQSGGCCDGSSPMCYPAGDFITGDSDVLLGVFEPSRPLARLGQDGMRHPFHRRQDRARPRRARA